MPMPDKKVAEKHTYEQSSSQTGFPAFNPFDTVVPKAIASINRMNGDVIDAGLKCGIEMLDFYKQGFQEDRNLATKVCSNGEPRDAVRAWMDFWNKAVVDYSGEASKLTRLNAEIATETVKHLSDDANVISNDFAKAAA